MSIKVLKAKLKNFCKFEDFECKFFDGVTRLVGMNGSGKSTIGLRGLMACINGIAESSSNGRIPGERFRFIGKSGKSADVEYEFTDEQSGSKFTIKNHITGQSNKITFKSDGQAPIGEDWLKGFLNISLMSAKEFCRIGGREQAKLLGIDTSSFDEELKKYKTEATGLNARLKAFGELDDIEPVVEIDIAEIDERRKNVAEKLNALYKENHAENDKRRKANIKELESQKKEMEQWELEQNLKQNNINVATGALNTLIEIGYNGSEVQLFIDKIPKPETTMPVLKDRTVKLIEPEIPDDSELKMIDEEKQAAFENNIKAQEYKTYLNKRVERDEVKKLIEENKGKQKECINARNDYMAGQEFGFKGLTTDDDGCLLLNNRPITDSYFSTGELELIVAKLHASQNPEFKCRFIDDFEHVDSENQEKILKELLDNGFQVIVAEVGKKSDKDNVIVLSECKISEEEEGKTELL